jgi:hypothetical protein
VTPPSKATTLADLGAALDRVAVVLRDNGHRGNEWCERHSTYTHTCHSTAHLAAWREHQRLNDLEHAAVRALMALELALRDAAPEDAA